jgi:putative membrane protein
MKPLAAIAGLCLLVAAPAVSLSADEMKTPTTDEFVKEVAVSDMFEIQSSELAAQKSDAATKAFASQMITDHRKTSDELKSLIKSADIGVTPPTTLDTKHQTMLDKLKNVTGSSFEKDYHKNQVAAHKAAVSLFERYAKDGENPKLKNWAATTLPTLQHHLQMAEALAK